MKSLVLTAYLAVSARAASWGERQLQKRLAVGKEDADRLGERRGQASQPRPDGRLIWFHAASVGESLSLLEVIDRLSTQCPDLSFLMTTGTVTSAQSLAARIPARTIHQYVPLDALPFVRSFLDHWKPDLAIWTESELWPGLITETSARKIPMLLLNARMSERSAKCWGKMGRAAKQLFSCFKAIQVQDDATALYLRQLGVPPAAFAVTGTLKEGTPPPPCNEAELSEVTKSVGGRAVWCAASTHEGEDAVVLEAHRIATADRHGLLLILVPRHPDRGDAVAKLVSDAGWHVARRSLGEVIQPDIDVYLADTMGEMGLWYRLSPISFVGGSLVPVGGHNPYEPAALGSAIIHGGHTKNFADIYNRLTTNRAAIKVHDGAGLGAAVSHLLKPNESAPLAYRAWELCSSGADATEKALAVIETHLPNQGQDT